MQSYGANNDHSPHRQVNSLAVRIGVPLLDITTHENKYRNENLDCLDDRNEYKFTIGIQNKQFPNLDRPKPKFPKSLPLRIKHIEYVSSYRLFVHLTQVKT